MKFLAANGMDKGTTQLLDLDGDDAVEALKQGKIDAAFLMGELVRGQVTRDLLKVPGIRLMNFRQADGYMRRLKFLSRLTLPEGAFDLGQDLPPHDVELVGPTVELIAHEDLHPALSDLLIAAAREIHVPRACIARPENSRHRWSVIFRSARMRSASTVPGRPSCTRNCRSGWRAWWTACWWCWCRWW